MALIDLTAFVKSQSIDHLIVLNVASTEPVFRLGPIHKEWDALEPALADAHRPPSGQRILFLNKFGSPLSTQVAAIMIRGYAQSAGIDKKVSAHVFRHTFATQLLARGVPITFSRGTFRFFSACPVICSERPPA